MSEKKGMEPFDKRGYAIHFDPRIDEATKFFPNTELLHEFALLPVSEIYDAILGVFGSAVIVKLWVWDAGDMSDDDNHPLTLNQDDADHIAFVEFFDGGYQEWGDVGGSSVEYALAGMIEHLNALGEFMVDKCFETRLSRIETL